MEKNLGTIDAGKLADITIMDKDITNCEADEILSSHTLLTIMDGKIVYEA